MFLKGPAVPPLLLSYLLSSSLLEESWGGGEGRGWLVARADRNKKRAALALICKGISGITLSTPFSFLPLSLFLFHFYLFRFVVSLRSEAEIFKKTPRQRFSSFQDEFRLGSIGSIWSISVKIARNGSCK